MSKPTGPTTGGVPADLEARVAAMSALVKALLTTLMLRGLLTRAEIAPLLVDAEALMTASGEAGKAELRSVQTELPSYLREAMGPAPDDDDHDH